MAIPGPRSIYRFCVAYDDLDGNRFLTDPEPFAYRELSDTIEHTVSDGDTLTKIAARYYAALPNPQQLWVVIAGFQPEPIHDPSVALVAGDKIFVPGLRTILTDVFAEARRAEYPL